MNANTTVVVIGGGYAGVTAANRLTRDPDVTVVLVNPRTTFVERIRLHQLVAGTDDAVVDYRDVLADGIRLVADTVTRIDAADRKLSLSAGGTLDYDYLVYAAGSSSAGPDVPGAIEFAYPVATLEEAARLHRVLAAAPADASVVVVGAGPTGIETAAELAEQGHHMTLAGTELGPYLHPRARRWVARRLAGLGVDVLDGPGATVAAVTRAAVRLRDGREVPGTVTIWTAGFGVPVLARVSGLRTDAAGRLLTDETLTSVDDERIVAAGDCAAPSGLPFRMSCQAAGQLGGRAADTVLSRLAGAKPRQLGVVFVGQCISLGRRNGIVQVARRNDAVVGLHLPGRAGSLLKGIVTWGPVRQLAVEARHPGLFTVPAWAADPERRRLLARRADTPGSRVQA